MAIFYLILMPLPHIISPWPSAVRRSPEASGAEHGWGSLWVGVCPQPAFTVFSRPETQDSINPSNPCHCGCLPLKGWQKWGVFFFFVETHCACPQCAAAATRWQRSAASRRGCPIGHGDRNLPLGLAEAPCCGGPLAGWRPLSLR